MSLPRENDVLRLSRKAFDESHADAATEQADLKAVANVLLLHEDTRQEFADAGYAVKTGKRLHAWNADFMLELICSRILFLLTYKTTFDFAPLIRKSDLIDSILSILDYHAQQILVRKKEPQRELQSPDSVDMRALSETLKLVFNLIQFYPGHARDFRKLLDPVLALVQGIDVQSDPLVPPVTYIINVLLNIQLENEESEQNDSSQIERPSSIFSLETPNLFVQRLIHIFTQSIQVYSEDALEAKIIPLLTLLRRVVDIGPQTVTDYIAKTLLPSDAERDQPLGSSETLASKLLNLSTTPAAPQLRDGVSSLLFELSDKDPATFVRNVGYGYASGYLMSHKIALPATAVEGDVGEKVTSIDGREINPVTGQRRDKEPPNPAQDMTDEEKEREAERLFVLFERLKATGVVSVANPVEVAAREGRLEEVTDSESE